MSVLDYILATERMVGSGHGTRADTLNRALRSAITASGLDPDESFTGFLPGLRGTGSPEGAVTGVVGQVYTQDDGTGGEVVWFKNSGTGNTGWRPLQSSLGVVHVDDFGAVGDGSTDDTTAIQDAIDAAVAAQKGEVWFASKTYRCTASLTVPTGLVLKGTGRPASINGTDQAFTVLEHYFDGDFLVFTGATGTGAGYGCGLENLSLYQSYGSSGGAGVGKAISLVTTSDDVRPIWLRAKNVNVEWLSSAAPWTHGFYLDGTANTNLLRDCWIESSRIAIDTTGTSAVTLLGCANVWLIGVEANLAGSNVAVSGDGTHKSTNIHLIGCSVSGTLALDYVNNLYVVGGAYSAITNTANTGAASAAVVLVPGLLSTAFTNNNGINTYLGYYNRGTGYEENQDHVMDYGFRYNGKDSGGSVVRMVEVDSSGRVLIGGGGAAAQFTGQIRTAAGQTPISNGDQQFGSGSFRYKDGYFNGLLTNVVSKTAAYTVTSGDCGVLADATSAAFTVTLPAVASHLGRMVWVKKTDASVNAVTVDPNGAETIDGAATVSLTTQYQGVLLFGTSGGWVSFAS